MLFKIKSRDSVATIGGKMAMQRTKQMILKESINENALLDINMTDDFLDGGVYMFTIDDIPLYVGETNIFAKRIIEHLYELRKDNSFFGTNNLEENHVIKFLILASGYDIPYEITKEDIHKGTRVKIQNEFIECYRPLLQNPLFISPEEIASKKKKDNMLNDRDKLVNQGLLYRDEYKSIINEINQYKKKRTF